MKSFILISVLIIAGGLAAADYSAYTPKDFDSFMREVKNSKECSIAVSNSPTFAILKEQLVDVYPNYELDFKLPMERIIPFDILNELNKTILFDIYVPYSLLLKERVIDAVFQRGSSLGEFISKPTKCAKLTSLIRTMMLPKITEKIEGECFLNNMFMNGQFQKMQVVLAEERKAYENQLQAQLDQEKARLELYRQQLDQEQENKIKVLEQKHLQEKETLTQANWLTVSRLKNQLEIEKNADHLNAVLLQATTARKSILETMYGNACMQRNILLCLLVLLGVIKGYSLYYQYA